MLFKFIPESNYENTHNIYWWPCPVCNNIFLYRRQTIYIDIMRKYDPQLWECDYCNTLLYVYQRTESYKKNYHPNVLLFNPYGEE